MKIGAFEFDLSMDISNYSRGILDANALNAVFGDSFAQFIANPLLGSIAILKDVGRGLLQTAEGALGYAESITRVAEEANISTTTLQTLREALDDAGVSADGADAAVQKFNIRMGDLRRDGGPAAAALKDVGVNINQIGDGDAALRAVIDGLSRIDDAGLRASLAVDLFDKQYGRAIANAVGKAGGIDALTQSFGALIVSSERLASAVAIDDRIDALGNAFESLKRSLTFEALDAFADRLGAGKDLMGQTGDVATRLTPQVRSMSEAVADLVNNLDKLAAAIEAVKDGGGAIGEFFAAYGAWTKSVVTLGMSSSVNMETADAIERVGDRLSLTDPRLRYERRSRPQP